MTLHVRVVPEEVQVSELKVPDPELVKLTVPVGSTAVPGLVSVTVAVQVTAEFGATDDGVQVTVVDVALTVALTVVVPELDP